MHFLFVFKLDCASFADYYLVECHFVCPRRMHLLYKIIQHAFASFRVIKKKKKRRYSVVLTICSFREKTLV